MKKAKVEKLDKIALPIMAAIMGVSNMGQDHFFKDSGGKGAYYHYYRPEKAAEVYRRVKASTWHYTPKNINESATDGIAGSLYESDEMAGWFHQEAWSWVKHLKPMPVSEIKRIWPDYARSARMRSYLPIFERPQMFRF